jgi:hypothetical protein
LRWYKAQNFAVEFDTTFLDAPVKLTSNDLYEVTVIRAPPY